MTDTQRTCPQCQREMREADCRGVRLDACACGGLWFDRGELETWLSPEARAAMTAPELAGPTNGLVRCPCCDADSLASRQRKQMHYSLCAGCGGVFVPAATLAILEPATPDFGQSLAHGLAASDLGAGLGDVFGSLPDLLGDLFSG